MRIHVSKLKELAAEWLDAVVMPRSNAMQKFVITFALLQKGEQLTQMLMPLADADGMIELDHITAALDKSGGSLELPYIHWVVDKSDVDKLLELAKRYE